MLIYLKRKYELMPTLISLEKKRMGKKISQGSKLAMLVLAVTVGGLLGRMNAAVSLTELSQKEVSVLLISYLVERST